MSERDDDIRARLRAARSMMENVLSDIGMASVSVDNTYEITRRILGRWDAFDAVVVKAQAEMRRVAAEHKLEYLAHCADEIDQVRMGIGGQP